MSWSLQFIGKPNKVAEALEKHSAVLTGQSKIEYDDAKPHLIALVEQNFAKEGTSYHEHQPLLRITASGSGSAQAAPGSRTSDQGGAYEQVHRQCTVQMESIYGVLV